jgi:hypothetical protein
MAPARSKSLGTITINRAPVLTLWAAVVAERLGYDGDEAATFGKMVAGLQAASKAQWLGIARAHVKDEATEAKKRARTPGRKVEVGLLGRMFAAVETEQGLRALKDGRPVSPESVQRYLESKFGDQLDAARGAMLKLARSRPPKKLAEEGFALYEAFRPDIPRGTKGWGAKGVLDLDRIVALAGSHE